MHYNRESTYLRSSSCRKLPPQLASFCTAAESSGSTLEVVLWPSDLTATITGNENARPDSYLSQTTSGGNNVRQSACLLHFEEIEPVLPKCSSRDRDTCLGGQGSRTMEDSGLPTQSRLRGSFSVDSKLAQMRSKLKLELDENCNPIVHSAPVTPSGEHEKDPTWNCRAMDPPHAIQTVIHVLSTLATEVQDGRLLRDFGQMAHLLCDIEPSIPTRPVSWRGRCLQVAYVMVQACRVYTGMF